MLANNFTSCLCVWRQYIWISLYSECRYEESYLSLFKFYERPDSSRNEKNVLHFLIGVHISVLCWRCGGHHVHQKPSCPSIWALPMCGDLITIFRRRRLPRAEQKEHCFAMCCWPSWPLSVSPAFLFPSRCIYLPCGLSSGHVWASCLPFCSEVCTPCFIFLRSLEGSAGHRWLSPAQCRVSVRTALSFSVTLHRTASRGPLRLLSPFEYRSKMGFEKSKLLPAELWVCSFFQVRSESPTSYILQPVEVSLKSSWLRRAGGFSLVSFLLRPICFLQANHKGNKGNSFPKICIPCLPGAPSTRLPLLPSPGLHPSHLETSYSPSQSSVTFPFSLHSHSHRLTPITLPFIISLQSSRDFN